MLLALTALLTCCTSDDVTTEQTAAKQGAPLSFDVAEVVEEQTRSGSAGNIDYSVLSKSGYGFGVIAGAPLSWDNKQVKYVDDAGTNVNPGSAFFYPSKWKYWTSDNEIKYWEEDINGAAVNFYAYAPYVESPSGSTGITEINSTDKTISYHINPTIGQGVDLLWGVNGSTGLPWEKTTYSDAGTKQDPNLPTGGPVLFTFRHALAAIGFRTQVMINQENITTDFEDKSAIEGVLWSDDPEKWSGNYKVTIKKIELIGNFHPSGTLSLDNGTKNVANWTSKATEEAQTLTVSADPDGDGNSDDGQIMASIRHPHAKAKTTEGVGGDDTDAETIMKSATIIGVSQDAIIGVSQDVQQQVAIDDANGKESCFFVIPSDARNYTLKLYWCVSAKLPDIETERYIAEDHVNTINISSLELKAGTKYLLTFVIGLKLIGLTVEATDWNTENVNAQITIEHGTSASESLAK